MKKSTGRIITVEENNVIGELGSAVSEVVTEFVPVLRLGINDIYTKSGSYEELLDKYGLSPYEISMKIKKFIK
ncbi:transketolase C-terminal domain-containing protein [uncultured Clostridium sp.]|uniref:transketolase C-terminal domain-containing protein n=1 Tax=uncultured Clostridium sp. TaxID=59620 RepID=UPI0025F06E05|nr:transketolase C-terminal domain-containing protein [uncultured Clostridium sp.]